MYKRQTYHISLNPTKVEGVCDKWAGSRYQRDDDQEATVKTRLEAYHSPVSYTHLDVYKRQTMQTVKNDTSSLRWA